MTNNTMYEAVVRLPWGRVAGLLIDERTTIISLDLLPGEPEIPIEIQED